MINYAEIMRDDSGNFPETESAAQLLQLQVINQSSLIGFEQKHKDIKKFPLRIVGTHSEVTKRIKKRLYGNVVERIKQRIDNVIAFKIQCAKEQQNFAKIYPLTFSKLSTDSPIAALQRQGLANSQYHVIHERCPINHLDALRTTPEEFDSGSQQVKKSLCVSLDDLKRIVTHFLTEPGHFLDVYERHFFYKIPYIVYCEIVDVFNKKLGLIKAKRRQAMIASDSERQTFQREKIKWVG
jgi:hypothetical protein